MSLNDTKEKILLSVCYNMVAIEMLSQKSKVLHLAEKDGIQPLIMGRVISVGPGTKQYDTGNYVPADIKVGDLVYFDQYGGKTIDIQINTEMYFENEHGKYEKMDPKKKYMMQADNYVSIVLRTLSDEDLKRKGVVLDV